MSKATELAQELFAQTKEAVKAAAPGLDAGKIFADLAGEGKRLMTQGTMELAAALFNGSAFVPYGPGQYTPHQSDQDHGMDDPRKAGVEQNRDGLSR